jgi:hypothetical protein
MRTSGLTLLALLGLAVAGVAGCGENPVPDFPSYKLDVAPLMGARCVRCHGAGGTLNEDKDIPSTFAFKGAPLRGYFDRLEDQGTTCVPPPGVDGVDCKRGLGSYAGTGAFSSSVNTYLKYMPPPPAPALTARENEILTTWFKNPLP